ncbi:MAG: right-handed parallel beta-helix repeat-containing protein [Kofleriaceae bacterium]|nr:right-handed parallel beta-helix repeat-containing protein [Kofleriaceae bacterium]
MRWTPAVALPVALVLVLSLAFGCGGEPSPGDGDGGGGVGGGGGDGGAIDAPDGTPACDAPASFADGLVPTRLLHVAAGAGGGGDGSVGRPFATIQQAAAAATPGTAIRLGPGEHTSGQYVAGLRGTATAPIWIGGEPGQPRPVLRGAGQALHLVRPAYVVVHDLEVTGQTANGLNVDDGGDFADDTAAHHVVLRDLHVHDVGTGGNNDCIKVSGVNDLHVLDSRIERCGAGGSGIDHVGCHRSVVARNTFAGAMSTAVQAKGGSTDVDVRQNRIAITGPRAVNLGGSTDLDLFRPPLSTSAPNAEARRIRVFANVITGLGDTATPFAFVGCIDCLAAHNLVRGRQRWNVRILQETASGGGYTFEPAANGRVLANTFVFAAASLSTAVNVGGGTDAASFTFSHNLWYASDGGSSTPSLPVTETGGVVGQASGYDHLPDDPQAPITAACVGAPEAGAGVHVPEVTGTLAGACRAAPPAAVTIGPQDGC